MESKSNYFPNLRNRKANTDLCSGRSDLLWMSTQGTVTTYINQRGEGKGLAPRWLAAGVTHAGAGEDIGDTRSRVQFGRICGSGRRDVSRIITAKNPSGNQIFLEHWSKLSVFTPHSTFILHVPSTQPRIHIESESFEILDLAASSREVISFSWRIGCPSRDRLNVCLIML